eukprot:m.470126 g.470126  ORF g.470126 m.470126 type:complete len:478 (-) comp29431_c0_seq1:64-1497(-)
MGEIIHLQVGQCGNQVGTRFWETITAEHGISATGEYEGCGDLQLERVGTFFDETESGQYVPRACLADLDPGTVDVVRASTLGALFSANHMVSGPNGGGNNWAKGYYTEGAEIIDSVVDTVRHRAEACDLLHGFQLCHSLGGASGSGLGGLLIERLKDDYPEQIMTTYSVFPSNKVSDTVVEPYNFGLGLHRLTEAADLTYVFDNEALYDHIFRRTHNPVNVTNRSMNKCIAGTMADITSTLRFPAELNTDYRRIGMNLVPFARLKLLLSATSLTELLPPPVPPKATPAPTLPIPLEGDAGAPLKAESELSLDQDKVDYEAVNTVFTDVFNPRNCLAACDFRHGRHIVATLACRGDLSPAKVQQCEFQILNKGSSYFAEWIPSNFKATLSHVPPAHVRRGGTLTTNSTVVRDVIGRISEQYDHMYRRKAFLMWYVGEGMDSMDFEEAGESMHDLISEYTTAQDATAEEDSDLETLDDD